MKMKNMMIVSAVSAATLWSTSAYAALHAYGDDFAVSRVIRTVEATKVADVADGLPLVAGDEVYFDVELALDKAEAVSFSESKYTPGAIGERPRLLLNAKLKGASPVPSDAGEYDPAIDTAVQTKSAVAYWHSSYISENSVWNRFVYTVRPGDVIEDIDLMYEDNALVVEGNISNLSTQVMYAGATTVTSIPMSAKSFNLTTDAAATLAQDKTITKNKNGDYNYAIAGYTITVGDAGDANEAMFYKGLVPVTVALDDATAVPTQINSTKAVKYSLWLQIVDQAGNVQQLPAKVTTYATNATVVQGADSDVVAPLATFNKDYAAVAFVAPKTAGYSQRFYVSLPEGVVINDTDTVRVCYGAEQNSNLNNHYGYALIDVQGSPVVEDTSTSGYDLGITNPAAITECELNAADIMDSLVGNTVDDVVAPGGKITLSSANGAIAGYDVAFIATPAGSKTSITIDKHALSNLASYGTLYAYIEQVTKTTANVTPDSFVVPLKFGSGLHTVTFSALDNATNATAVYRVRIPGLAGADKPFYLVIQASPRQEEINIAVDETGGAITEYYMPAEIPANGAAVSPTITKFTATFLTKPANTATRYFLVHPVFSDGRTEITEDYYFKDLTDADGEKLSVLSVLRKVAQVQTSPNGIMTVVGDSLRLRLAVANGVTSADFYVVALNNFALETLKGAAIVKKDADNGTFSDVDMNVPGPLFAVRSCNVADVITGTADICDTLASVTVNNRAPQVKSYSAQGSTTLGARVPFSFDVVDVKSDYIVAEMIFDTNDTTARAYRLIANEDDMIAQMGADEWEKRVEELEKKYEPYGVKAGDFSDETKAFINRTSEATSLTFSHIYETEGNKNWEFNAYDSSNAYITVKPTGTIEITSAQKFTFNVVNLPSRPGLGYVLWANDKDTAAAQGKWTFYTTSTVASLPRTTGTLASVIARPFAAGGTNASDTFDDLTPPSATHDSFFYKWAASNDYVALLPDGADPAQTIYSPVLNITRAFTVGGATGGGADANDPKAWSDVMLSAIFTAELYPGDALEAFDMVAAPAPNVWSLGDYNQDSVPDGWLINGFGEDAYAMIESPTTLANTGSEGDVLPWAGWGSADEAYANAFINGTHQGVLTNPWPNPQVGPFGLGAPFTYSTRVRGLDSALNAADGRGNWLSAPAWRVMLRPTVVADAGNGTKNFINVGTVNADKVYTATDYIAHDLYMGTLPEGAARTDRHKVPYATAAVNLAAVGGVDFNTDWRYVLDANGKPMDDANYPGHAVIVNTNPDSPNYEEILDIATNGWYYGTVTVDPATDEQTTVYTTVPGVPFPFNDVTELEAAITAAQARDADGAFVVANLGGQVNEKIDKTYRFADWRVPAGILIDEAFSGNDPRNTSWLERYVGNSADANGNGVNNGMEYYLWYYASRIAFASVYDVADQNGLHYTQVNADLWPAIDIIHNANEIATDTRFGTQNRFVLGRAYNNNYDPDAPAGSYSAEGTPNAADAQGNYWNPIPVESILPFVSPMGAQSAGLAASDFDNDGLSMAEEIALGTNPIDCDTDNDWIIDGWEANYEGINPLDPLDAGLNPDNDFFARKVVYSFPEAHQLYLLECATLPEGAQAAFYDTTDACIRYLKAGAVLDPNTILTKDDLLPKTLPWNAPTNGEMANIKDVKTDAVYTYMKRDRVVLRHHDVYKSFGFSPFTAWDNQIAENTAPFVTVEEFNAWVLERLNVGTWSWVNPTLADTNNDTIPDGWSLYVKINPFSLIPNDDDPEDRDGVINADEYAHGEGLKPYPSDPASYDTDLDGVIDGDEIAAGMNPCSWDSDADGVADGYEYLWRNANAPELGPDPTNAADYDMDFDGDGLSTYHEYMTGLFRHFRYDLSPAASRLYKGTRGTLNEDDTTKWVAFPDLYNVYEDLLNPSEVSSIEYYNGEDDAVTPLYVNPMKLALANTENSTDNRAINAVRAAVTSIWTRSIIVPTQEQVEARVPGADAIGEFITELDAVRVYLAAADRAVLETPDPSTMSAAHYAVTKIDAFFKNADHVDLLTNAKELALLNTYQEGAKLWKVRREKIAAIVDNYYTNAPGSIKVFIDNLNAYRNEFGLAPFNAVDQRPGTLVTPGVNYAPMTYEALFNGLGMGNTATQLNGLEVVDCPLLLAQYRTAVRGFSGGLWCDRIEFGGEKLPFFAPIGYHMAVKPLIERLNTNYFLGELPEVALAGEMPIIRNPNEGRQLFSTSPVLADSDADGMDDYWEIFHGINPMLGDYVNDRRDEDVLGDGHSADLLAEIYEERVENAGAQNPAAFYTYTPEENAFGNLLGEGDDDPFGLKASKVTGFDYYTLPWFSGVPFMDADGDALLNYNESVNPESSADLYGTDPSALWMTDPNNENSYVARFYTLRNIAERYDSNGLDVDASIEATYPTFQHPNVSGYMVMPGEVFPIFSFEVNEGYDTDADGLADLTEVTSTNGNYSGDPQSAISPSRNFSAYFGGEGAMQTAAMVQFGPTALTTFTVECWVNPDANAPDGEMVLVDRPWSFSDRKATADLLRHNFVLGLKRENGMTYPYAFYTGAGTAENGTQVPSVSPRAVSTKSLETVDENGDITNAGAWSHLAAVYDGKALTLYINGVSVASTTTTLIPANGIMSFVNSEADGELPPVTYTYRKAPILIGATPTENWFAEMQDILVEANKQATPAVAPTAWADYYQKCYMGYIDEVRIWDRARTAAEIAENYQKTFSVNDLVTLRLNAMMDRLGYADQSANGVYEDTVRAYPVAIYTFDDLLSSTKNAPDAPFEVYAGQKLVGDKTTPGSFLYRRPTMMDTAAPNALPLLASGSMTVNGVSVCLPTTKELFTSYYAIQTPDFLKSTMYADADVNYEYIPSAQNVMSHIPRFDIDLAADDTLARRVNLLTHAGEVKANNGNPWLTNVPMLGAYKMLDTAFWRNGYSGWNVNLGVKVKANWNPYGFRYVNAPEFNQDLHMVDAGYSMVRPTDLMIYGDAYGRYTVKSWNPDVPTTDPSKGDAVTSGVEGTPHWFEHNDKNADTGENINDKQFSVGGEILDSEVAMGQTNDRDEDRMPDWWERYYGLDPEDPTLDNGAFGDEDGDFLTNYAEFLAPSNPKMYSTAGNGIPDFHVPLYYRRGAPIMGLLYSDADFMEDHWEHALATTSPSVDIFDMYADPDQDGWSNYAEVRVNTRGKHSTNPNAKEEQDLMGTVAAYPTPALVLQVDYFGDNAALFPEENDDVEVEDGDEPAAEEETSRNIVIHTFTAAGNQSAPDAIFVLPMASADEEDGEDAEAEGARTQMVGRMNFGTTTGHLEPGNIKAGSIQMKTVYYQEISPDGNLNGYTESDNVTIRDDGKGNLKAFFRMTTTEAPEEEGGEPVETVTWFEKVVGSINYTTGAYTYTIDPADYASNELYDTDGNFIAYFEDVFLNATYDTVPVNTLPATFTFSQPVQGHIREGKNNFFVFLDLNGNNLWNEGEPAGVPDQHDVDIGYDTINRQLRVTLTENAPPGAIRVDIQSIIDTFMEEKRDAEIAYREAQQNANNNNGGNDNGNNNNDDEDVVNYESTIKNPLNDNFVVRWDTFVGGLFTDAPKNYQVILYFWKADDQLGTGQTFSYCQALNISKPYITEDEIFAANPKGLDASDNNAPGILTMKYVVCLVPEGQYSSDMLSSPDAVLSQFAVGVVVNNCGTYDQSLTKLCDAKAGNLTGIVRNSDLAISWESTTQVPSFDLEIVKTHNAANQALAKPQTVLKKTGIRGVAACDRVPTASATNITPVYKYSYELPNIIGEIYEQGENVALCGNGGYRYTVTLKPFSGKPAVLTGTFLVQLNDSREIDGDTIGTVETYLDTATNTYKTGEVDTSFNAYNSYYVRANVRYNGVLKHSADFNGGLFRIEAHRSASFNGTPIASTSDLLVYDKENEDIANLNHCVIMEKVDAYKNADNEEIFFATRFRTEIRGLASNEPVYLMAYLDLNKNAKRDEWEPWGYLAKGRNSEVQGYYYDPVPVTPVGSSQLTTTEFYIQDVDVDNDKLADAWEWKTVGFSDAAYATWNGQYSGLGNAYAKSGVLWTKNSTGVLSLTAFGAQVYGINVIGAEDENGSVKTEIDQQLADVSVFADILSGNSQLALALEGYTAYELAVENITFDGEDVTIAWGLTAENAAGETSDVTTLIANKASNAKYVVYGSDSLTGEWAVVAEGTFDAATTDATLNLATVLAEKGIVPAFFKVVIGVAE